MLALQPLPGDAGDAGHQPTHLVEHLAGIRVAPGQAQAAPDLLDDPQVLSRVAGWRQRLTAHLHDAVGVGEAARLLGERAGRQDHVGQVGGLGQEDVLHHQVFQRRQRLARVVGVGVRHGRVLALHVHAPDHAGLDRLHDLDHRQADLSVQRPGCELPGLLEALAHLRARDMLVVGQHHRDQAGVGRPLHVVLAAQRVQAGARAADLPGHQGQRDQAARVVGAVHMLADAHAPQDHRAPGGGVGAPPRAAPARRCRRPAPSPPAYRPARCGAAHRSRWCARR
jgi:hypothetical protein